MDYFDLLKELRKGAPEVAKAAKAMKFLGWACMAGAGRSKYLAMQWKKKREDDMKAGLTPMKFMF